MKINLVSKYMIVHKHLIGRKSVGVKDAAPEHITLLEKLTPSSLATAFDI